MIEDVEKHWELFENVEEPVENNYYQLIQSVEMLISNWFECPVNRRGSPEDNQTQS